MIIIIIVITISKGGSIKVKEGHLIKINDYQNST